jgi:inner membrane protein
MDNITHTLTGIALGQAGLKHTTRFAIWALIIGSNLPDIDAVAGFCGNLDYLKYHRGITHSLLGLTGLAGILALLIYVFGRSAAAKKNRPALRLKWLFLVCWIATGCHVLMDYTNQYGIRPFLPFSGRWIALDIMPIVGPYVLLLLVLGLGIPTVLRLASEEVGENKRASTGVVRTGAVVGLCGILLVGGVRALAHQRALGLLNANDYGQEVPHRVGAFPTFVNPFEWTGVVETRSSYYLLDVNTLAAGIDLSQSEVLRKPAPSEALSAAEHTKTARSFLTFSRFPWAVVLGTENRFNVYVRDLRFASLNSSEWGFVLEVQLNRCLQVRRESFSFFRASPME